MTRSRPSRRAQVVLAAAVVATVAFVPLVAAYLQLGYAGDVTAARPGTNPTADTTRALERATNDVRPDLARTYRWDERRDAVDAFERAMEPRLAGLQRAFLDDGVAVRIVPNASAAAAWRRANCPRGEGRRFGGCAAVEGVAVQNRVGRTHVLAAAFDVVVVEPERTTRVTVVVRRW